ncbi:hypothetical protein HC928_23920 [bacterium]|nr:hypothetical protein [bacterium]
MTPKEELIEAIERSPDDVIRALLELVKVLQRQYELSNHQLVNEAPPSERSGTTVEPSNYNFSDLAGRLTWKGDGVAVQRVLRDEW